MSNEMVRMVAKAAREKETRTRETLKKDQHALAHVISQNLTMPGMRLFIPMSSVAYANPQALDISGNGNHLTNNNASTFGYTGLIPHVSFDGSNQYLSKADGGAGQWADITGLETYIDAADRGMYVGGLFYIDQSGRSEILMSKWSAAGGNRSFILWHVGTNQLRFQVSDDGTTTLIGVDSAAITEFDRWYFIFGRFIPGVSVDLFVNDDPVVTAATAAASLFDGNSPFEIGAYDGGTASFLGKAAMCNFGATAPPDGTFRALYQQSRSLFEI